MKGLVDVVCGGKQLAESCGNDTSLARVREKGCLLGDGRPAFAKERQIFDFTDYRCGAHWMPAPQAARETAGDGACCSSTFVSRSQRFCMLER